MLTQHESVGERAVGEDKVGRDDAENSWRNSLTLRFYTFGGCCAAGSRLEYDSVGA